MKKILSLFIYLCFLTVGVFSQTVPDKDKEKEIKLTGKYYYGEAVCINDSVAKQTAREELMSDIAREYTLFKEGDILANGIKYLSFLRGNKIRAIAYILKSDVSNTNKKQNDLKINEIKYSDNVTSKSNTDTILKPESKSKVDTNKINENNISPADKFISTLLTISNFDELLNKLYDQKYKGKLMYGKESAFATNKENCYIILLNSDNKIKTILGKGVSKRFDYKNNRFVSNYKELFKDTNEIWLFIID